MALVWVACALAAVLAGSVVFIGARLRRRHQRFLAAVPHLDPEGSPVLSQPRALYHGTRFADGFALGAPAWKDPCVCDLWCTEAGLFVRREGGGALLCIAFSEVGEAALHRAFAPIAGKDLPMLRLRWRRGGESMETDLSVRGGMAGLESLRREIHLRQGNIAEQLAPLLGRPLP
ncbi:MAG TPA: hypothetical protein VFP52_16845 [Myxococcales bacterium]|nr:hypothetical protein [Myxococcales bacterium]